MEIQLNNKIYNTDRDEKLISFGTETLYRTYSGDYYIYGEESFIDRGYQSVIQYKRKYKYSDLLVCGYIDFSIVQEWISIIPDVKDVIDIFVEEYNANCKR